MKPLYKPSSSTMLEGNPIFRNKNKKKKWWTLTAV